MPYDEDSLGDIGVCHYDYVLSLVCTSYGYDYDYDLDYFLDTAKRPFYFWRTSEGLRSTSLTAVRHVP